MVLRLEHGDDCMLLTGDSEEETEVRVEMRGLAPCELLKVAHHGSAASTTDGFLAVVSPRLAVISAGEDNPFGHPTEEVTDRHNERLGEENIYCTCESGTIEFITDGERLWVEVGR